jgi:hypothetical protein
MIALLYIGGIVLLGFAVIAALYFIHPVLGWMGVGFFWWLAFVSDWSFPRRRRKPHLKHSDS